jgi:hypothetical protein
MSRKEEIVSFKADDGILAALEGVPNRSEFIRQAILAALGRRCPLCRGTGMLSEEQRRHWEIFATRHRIVECQDCHAFHLVCDAPPLADPRPKTSQEGAV